MAFTLHILFYWYGWNYVLVALSTLLCYSCIIHLLIVINNSISLCGYASTKCLIWLLISLHYDLCSADFFSGLEILIKEWIALGPKSQSANLLYRMSSSTSVQHFVCLKVETLLCSRMLLSSAVSIWFLSDLRVLLPSPTRFQVQWTTNFFCKRFIWYGILYIVNILASY